MREAPRRIRDEGASAVPPCLPAPKGRAARCRANGRNPPPASLPVHQRGLPLGAAGEFSIWACSCGQASDAPRVPQPPGCGTPVRRLDDACRARLAGFAPSPALWRIAYYSCPGLLFTCLVDPVGFEPTTFSMPLRRAPNCAMGPCRTSEWTWRDSNPRPLQCD